MYSVSNYLKNYLHKNVTNTFPSTSGNSLLTNLKVEVSSKGADYQSSLPMAMAKSLKQSPKDFTDKLIQNLSPEPAIRKVYFTDPGFLNIELENMWIANYIQNNIQQKHQKQQQIVEWKTADDRRKVLVDYASPNMCKELHVGHLRSVVLGESLSRILDYVGHSVTRISHVGDFGTPLGLVITQAIESDAPFVRSLMSQQHSNGSTLPQPQELSAMYVAAKQRSKTDLQFAKRAQDTVVQLQHKLATDPADKLVAVYQAVCAASRTSFEDIFKRLGATNLKEQGESFYVNILPGVVTELKQKGIAVEDQGATCVFVDGFKAPFIIQKSDGAYLYSTTDLAALQYRIKQGLDWMVYVTDESQKPHFQQLFKVGQRAGWITPNIRLDHIGFGIVKGPNGQKLSSRDGTPLTLLGLLNDSLGETTRILEEQRIQNPGTTGMIEQQDIAGVVETIAYNAIKYFDLCHPRDYNFSFSSMLSMKGNTAVYLLYALTRIASIKRKIPTTRNYNLSDSEPLLLSTEEDRSLALSILQFSDVISNVERSLAPHHLCEYLYALASKFHLFYDRCRILGDPLEQHRLQLCFAVERILKQGSHLLGLNVVDKM